MRVAAERAWATWPDIVAGLRRRWERGDDLAGYLAGRPWQPLGLAVRSPTARESTARFEEAREWSRAWEAQVRRWPGAGLRLERRGVGGRLAGANELPARVWVDGYEGLWWALGVGPQVRRLEGLVDQTRGALPELVPWVVGHPLRVLALAEEWARLVATAGWVRDRPGCDYLRQVDVPGVDTKFIESHRGVLSDLLDVVLDAGRIDDGVPRSDFVRRYGFRAKPGYVRLRTLGGGGLVGGFSEVMVRAQELAVDPPSASTVLVVENEVTFLALPDVADAVAVLGSGYAVGGVGGQWLAGRDVLYWGDLDTHGFAILDRLRHLVPGARSVLMDRNTLLAHRGQWVREPRPTASRLDRLTAAEAGLYRDLVEGTFGSAVRLEQERISYGAIRRALNHSSVYEEAGER
jgi:hypothetical protein